MNEPARPEPPADFDESPELTDDDFARARWHADGRLVDPVAYARLRLRELVADLEPTEGDARRRIEPALAAVQEALDALEKS